MYLTVSLLLSHQSGFFLPKLYNNLSIKCYCSFKNISADWSAISQD